MRTWRGIHRCAVCQVLQMTAWATKATSEVPSPPSGQVMLSQSVANNRDSGTMMLHADSVDPSVILRCWDVRSECAPKPHTDPTAKIPHRFFSTL